MRVDVLQTAIGKGLLRWGACEVACTLGRGGVRADKREGDGATPSGSFPFRRVLWRPDRLAKPATRLPAAALSPADGWCDWPEDPAYNHQVALPHPARHERLWRKDGLYDVIVIIGHNDSPVMPHAGSAVFVHVAREDGGPTDGCVGLARADLLDLLAGLDGDDHLVIAAG